MTPADGDCPLARAMRETLDAVVTPVVREALIHDALILAGLSTLPQRHDAMRVFAGGQLRAVVARALGAEMAASITDEILLTIGRSSANPPKSVRGQKPRLSSRAPASRRPAPQPRTTPVVPPSNRAPVMPPSNRAPVVPPSSRGRRDPGHNDPPIPPSGRRSATPLVTAFERSPTERPAWPAGMGSHIRGGVERDLSRALRDTDPAGDPSAHRRSPAAHAPLPFVFVASLDASLLDALRRASDGRARIAAVRTPGDLVKQLDELEGVRHCLVVLDGKAPSIRPAALAILLEDAANVRVVFCRADPSAKEFVRQVSASTGNWSIYAEPASLDRVAAECVRLVS